eukprot:Skav220449  [mRNA]  locus=scaffold254:167357:175609:- [translate_table: standard]
MQTLLVLSGETSRAELKGARGKSVPDYVAESVQLLEIVRNALSEGKAKLQCLQERCKEAEAAATESEALAAREMAEKAQETQKMRQQQQALTEVQKSLDCMAQGLWTSEEERAQREWWECFAALQQHLLDTGTAAGSWKSEGAECSLLTAATVSLKKRPAQRSDFDAIVGHPVLQRNSSLQLASGSSAVEGVASFLREQLHAADEGLLARPQLEMEAEAVILSRQSLLSATKQRATTDTEALGPVGHGPETSGALAATAACALPSSEAMARAQQKDEASARTDVMVGHGWDAVTKYQGLMAMA